MSKDGKLLCRVLGKADADSLYEILKEVTFIDPQAFLGNHLTSIKFPDNHFKFIDADSYYNELYNYYQHSDLEKNALALTEIDPNTFEGCTALAEISLPSTLTYIGHSAFEGCTALTNVTFHSNKRYDLLIDARAFAGCTAPSPSPGPALQYKYIVLYWWHGRPGLLPAVSLPNSTGLGRNTGMKGLAYDS